MKKCKSCQSEIDQKASKCPHCGADQRTWFLRHKIITAIGALFLFGFIGSASRKEETSPTSPTPTPTTSSVVVLTPTATSVPPNLSLKDKINKSLNDPRDTVVVTPSANGITVTVDTNDPVSEFGTGPLFYVSDAYMDGAVVFPSVFPLDPQIMTVTTNLNVQITDTYGKQSFKKLVGITLSRNTYNKIAWDNFVNTNFPQIADTYYYDTSIKASDIYPLGNP